MFLVVVVIGLSIVLLSSAQPNSQSSFQCNVTYNATFESINSTAVECRAAQCAAFLGTATAQQRMMMCEEGQQCNTMIENVISACGDTVSL